MANYPLDGRVAVITGASKGLGKQMAEALAQAGAAVVVVARNGELLEKVKAGIESRDGRAHAFVADIRKEDEVSRFAEQVRAQAGVPDILINNAGINLRKSLHEFTLEEWHRVMQTNLDSAFLCTRAFVPGPFATEMNTVLIEDPVRNAQFVSKIPVGRWGKVDEIGPLAVFLCSDAAGYITGTDILIDGGWTAQ
ncbi:MAG: SDR family oxidoreductase [Acidobacteriota bacterium]